MPIKPEHRDKYPPDWPAISLDAKRRAGWKCQHEGCTARQYAVGHWLLQGVRATWVELWRNIGGAETPGAYSESRQRAAEEHFRLYGDGPVPTGSMPIIVIVLTTAHLDHDPADCRPEALRVLCQRHHLAHDQQHHAESAYMTRMAKRQNQELPL